MTSYSGFESILLAGDRNQIIDLSELLPGFSLQDLSVLVRNTEINSRAPSAALIRNGIGLMVQNPRYAAAIDALQALAVTGEEFWLTPKAAMGTKVGDAGATIRSWPFLAIVTTTGIAGGSMGIVDAQLVVEQHSYQYYGRGKCKLESGAAPNADVEIAATSASDVPDLALLTVTKLNNGGSFKAQIASGSNEGPPLTIARPQITTLSLPTTFDHTQQLKLKFSSISGVTDYELFIEAAEEIEAPIQF